MRQMNASVNAADGVNDKNCDEKTLNGSHKTNCDPLARKRKAKQQPL